VLGAERHACQLSIATADQPQGRARASDEKQAPGETAVVCTNMWKVLGDA
jgi:hypothetical protein